MRRRTKDINLLETYNRYHIKTKVSSDEIILKFIAGEVILFFILTIVLYNRIMFINHKNKKLEEQINKMAEIEKKYSEFIAINNLYKNKSDASENIYLKNETTFNVITTLENITPTEVSYQSLNIRDGNKINLIVVSPKDEGITQLIYNMQNSNVFSNIQLNGITGQQNQRISNITAEIVRK